MESLTGLRGIDAASESPEKVEVMSVFASGEATVARSNAIPPTCT